MGWINLLWKFLRLGPLPIGALAAVIMGAGYYLQVLDNQRSAKEAQALRAGQPAVVQLADARQAEQLSIIGEVTVQAQLAWGYSYDLWYEENIGTDFIVMFPLIASNGTSIGEVLGVALLQAEDESFQTLSEDLVAKWFVEEGPYGPVMNLNGELKGMGKWQGLVEDSFYDEGITLPENPIVIWPYVEGRDVALAPDAPGSITIFGVFSKVAGVLGLLALGKLVFSGSGGAPAAPAGSGRAKKAFDTLASAAKSELDIEESAFSVVKSAVPLWKRRSGLGHETEQLAEPIQSEPATVFEPSEPELVAAPRRRFGIRKTLIVIVAGLLALGVLATVSDMVKNTTPTQSVSITSVEDLVAATAADAIVPDADPNRHWTDIDVTPVAEWFVAKFLLAAAGDQDAQIALGMIAGGLFVALFMIRWFFVMRRSLTPRTTARFDSMGIN